MIGAAGRAELPGCLAACLPGCLAARVARWLRDGLRLDLLRHAVGNAFFVANMSDNSKLSPGLETQVEFIHTVET